MNTSASSDAGIDLYGVPTLAPTTEAASTQSASTAVTTTADAGSAATTGSSQSAAVADNYRIQLAALKSQADADKAWKRILARHSDVLASLTVHIVRADLGSQGIYYRVQAGPFADRASAAAACEQLKSAGQQCLVKP